MKNKVSRKIKYQKINQDSIHILQRKRNLKVLFILQSDN